MMVLSLVAEWEDTAGPGHCGAELRADTPLRNRQAWSSQGSHGHHHHHHHHLTRTRDITEQHSKLLLLNFEVNMLPTAMKGLGTRVVLVKLHANITIWEILALENSGLPQEGFVMRDTFHKFYFIKWTFHISRL